MAVSQYFTSIFRMCLSIETPIIDHHYPYHCTNQCHIYDTYVAFVYSHSCWKVPIANASIALSLENISYFHLFSPNFIILLFIHHSQLLIPLIPPSPTSAHIPLRIASQRPSSSASILLNPHLSSVLKTSLLQMAPQAPQAPDVTMLPEPSTNPSTEPASDDGPLSQKLTLATAMSDPAEAEALYREIIAFQSPSLEPGATDPSVPEEDVPKVKELAIQRLAELLVRTGRASQLSNLLKTVRPFFATIAKAKTAKIVRGLLDAVSKADDAADLQFALCQETIQWCRDEKRTFLRQRVEGRLAALYLSHSRYAEALNIINELLREVKRLDDKAHLLEIQLVESRIHHALRNIPKARAALTSARTTANSIYVPLTLQAEIDMQAGIISAEEKDYKTAYSYFYEGFEGFVSLEDPRAVSNLKYMLLCKIMTGSAEDVPGIVNGSVALKFSGRQVDAMVAVAKAHSARSLEAFEKTLEEYKAELTDDPIVHAHLNSLNDTLKEQNLLRLTEPFSRVEIKHVAELINLDVHDVESKLSQMILDKKLNGILDQGAGCLIVYDDLPLSKTYQASLDTLVNMDNVVHSLFDKATTLR